MRHQSPNTKCSITDPDITRRVLMISYYWPPCGGPGALRPVKFAKYLPDYGIEPIVLTRKNIAYHSLDYELHHEVSLVRTIRTESLDPARLLYLAGMRSYKPRAWHIPLKQGLNFPDHKMPWLPFAFSAAKSLDFDSVYVTAPPFSAFLLGYEIAYASKKPLILDFRDSWLYFPFMPYQGFLQRSFVMFWEKKVTHAAHAIITVDDNIKDDLIKRYPDIAGRILVLPNGYDPDDFASVEKPPVFTLTYLGTVREERNPRTILDAVEQAIKSYGIKDLRFVFIGHVEEKYRALMNRYSFVQIAGHLPYKKALRKFARSHCSVMITTGDTYFFPSRQNEYLASGLPIVVCGTSKGIHVLHKAFKQGYPGWIYDFNDVDGMTERIGELYQGFKKGKLLQGKTPNAHYTRRNLTGQLAGIIKVVSRH
ncbi:glycosyltransferase [candidate division WOR-3 bacterium]|nr:glycosyltransferase [candidate division WOR-3 bacterium]